MTNNNNRYDRSKASWLARGLEQLLDTGGGDPSFDVVIVGSGYGGAIAANTFAGRQHNGNEISVCVLERGDEYLPGEFPHGLAEVPSHVRADQNKEGLFDARLGPDVSTLVANGVGGGSLINAGVMEVPRKKVFENRWPANLSDLTTWENYFDRTRELLGAGTSANPNTIEDHPYGIPVKTEALQEIADPQNSFRFAALTVAMNDSQSSANVSLNKCLGCGDCSTGCNFGAKLSLDVNLLASAHRKGAVIYSGATVIKIEKDGSDWLVNTVYTNATLRERLQGPGNSAMIRAKKVILAAGTLGSTEILKRSSGTLSFSDKLGKHCSTNGDMLVADYETNDVVNTVANENVRPSERTIGPTITGVIDLREEKGVLIEEMSVPAGIRRVFAEIFATTFALHGLNKADHSTHDVGFFASDLYSAWHARIDKSALYAVMGDDGAKGEVELVETNDDDPDGIAIGNDRDGIARIKWKDVQKLDLFDKQVETITNMTSDTGGKVIANPLWNLLPQEMSFLLDNVHGPVVTVHPLGGCIMADKETDGGVDDRGQVYNGNGAGTYHDGLVVLDGSIIPTALGTNPALTIAAVALRASELLAAQWGYLDTATLLPPPIDRPIARDTDYAFEPEGTTEIQLCERMRGKVDIRDAYDQDHECVVELTMRSEDTPVSKLTYPDETHPAELILDTTQDGAVTASRIRIYRRSDWEAFQLRHIPEGSVDDTLDAMAIFRAPLDTGTITVFERRKSNQFSRFFQAGPAYLLNRGLRDIWQALANSLTGGGSGGGILQRVLGFFRLSTRGGEKRWLRYNLQIGTPDAASTLALTGNEILGRKLFTYRRRANPWRQLMQMRLKQFPGMQDDDKWNLDLDLNFLVRIGIPLLRITKQSDGVTALAELGSFLGYFVRLLIGIHIWSFRRPDEDPNPAPVNPLPGDVPDIPVVPQEFPLDIGEEVPGGADDGVAVDGAVRLVLYEKAGATKPPIVMLHGYSASGTTFAHHAIPEGLAQRFWKDGRDVWVADLRTSAGMPTATDPWSMEQIAYRDIPEVFEYITNTHYGNPGLKIDVLAHCMGAVMFSMAALGDISNPPYTPAQVKMLNDLHGRINKVAFSQVGPLVVFSPANRFRAYAARYLSGFLQGDYQFIPPEPPTLADQLLDRVLASLPYPEEEFDIENPMWPCKRTPWTRTRHRMDALYGRDFNVRNVSDDMLRHIDDHFGPLSIKTVTQTIHFARYSTITDRSGYNSFVSRSTLNDTRWNFPVLSVHGRDNGLSDVTTVDRMRQILADAGREFESHIIPNAGHQDALIGLDRDKMANAMIAFFDAVPSGSGPPNDTLIAVTPWIGPIFTSSIDPHKPTIRLGASPTMREPEGVVMLRVQLVDNELRRHNDGMPFDAGDENFILTNMITYTSNELEKKRWDAFPMPRPPAVPSAGDGLLVLIVYAEARALPPQVQASFLTVLPDQFGIASKVVAINPDDWRQFPSDPALPPPSVALNDMRKIAVATLRTLRSQNAAVNTDVDVSSIPVGPAIATTDPNGLDPVDQADPAHPLQ